MNIGSNTLNLTIDVAGLQAGVDRKRSAITVLTSNNPSDENSFSDPNKVLRSREDVCFSFRPVLYITNWIFEQHLNCTRRSCRLKRIYPMLQKRCRSLWFLTRSLHLIWLWISTASSSLTCEANGLHGIHGTLAGCKLHYQAIFRPHLILLVHNVVDVSC